MLGPGRITVAAVAVTGADDERQRGEDNRKNDEQTNTWR
jgi:hypothetical protein